MLDHPTLAKAILSLALYPSGGEKGIQYLALQYYWLMLQNYAAALSVLTCSISRSTAGDW